MAIVAHRNEYSATIWPNGEYTIGRVREVEAILPSPDLRDCPRDLIDAVKAHGAVKLLAFYKENPEYAPAPLGSSNAPISQDLKRRRLRVGLTSYGARMLRNCCHLIEKKAPARTLCFFTGTIPDASRSQVEQVWALWPEAVRRFTQSISEKLRRVGMPGQIAYCSEIQGDRMEKYGLALPHIHACWQGRAPRQHWALPLESYHSSWRKVWVGLFPESAEWNWKPSTNCEMVKKSVVAYLAKYLSKGCSRNASEREKLPEYAKLPSWWGATGGIKGEVLRTRAHLVKEGARGFLDLVERKKGNGWSRFDIMLPLAQGEMWLGCCGRIPLPIAQRILRDTRCRLHDIFERM